MSSISTEDGLKLHVEISGIGSPVIFSSGYCQTGQNFSGQVDSLVDAGFKVVRWDYRGHGQSDAPSGSHLYSLEKVLVDLRKIVDFTSPKEPVVLAGLSFGGLASLHFALHFPDRVRALVLISTGPGFKKPEAQRAWSEQVERIAKRLEKTGFNGWTEGAAAKLAIGLNPSLPAAQAAGRAILSQDPEGVAHFGRKVTALAPGVVDDLDRIKQPAFILVGEHDKAFLRAGEVMASRLPNAKHTIVPSAGHVINIDQEEFFNQELLRFLESL